MSVQQDILSTATSAPMSQSAANKFAMARDTAQTGNIRSRNCTAKMSLIQIEEKRYRNNFFIRGVDFCFKIARTQEEVID